MDQGRRMFTGIVTDIGTVIALTPLPEGVRLRIETRHDPAGISLGASICCGGICLTARVNLERALKVGDELGGHIVSGHVDGTAEITGLDQEGDAVRFRLEAPASLARFIAAKGSVALDGTSLTVNGVRGRQFDVLLIRHSLGVTTWGERRTGDRVNIEVDTMARYAARLAEAAATEP
ncbi:MAG: riboflavin synthase, alpha subunit [Rhizobiaceae bacterium]|nr:riboflavin synthase, alpha subunit [Rhizobiaceae bacterium]